MAITAQDIAQLRAKTGAGMLIASKHSKNQVAILKKLLIGFARRVLPRLQNVLTRSLLRARYLPISMVAARLVYYSNSILKLTL
jgi:hypothetical protein